MYLMLVAKSDPNEIIPSVDFNYYQEYSPKGEYNIVDQGYSCREVLVRGIQRLLGYEFPEKNLYVYVGEFNGGPESKLFDLLKENFGIEVSLSEGIVSFTMENITPWDASLIVLAVKNFSRYGDIELFLFKEDREKIIKKKIEDMNPMTGGRFTSDVFYSFYLSHREEINAKVKDSHWLSEPNGIFTFMYELFGKEKTFCEDILNTYSERKIKLISKDCFITRSEK